MEDIDKNFWEVVLGSADLVVGFATFLIGFLIYKKGIAEYRGSNKVKRAEFLEKLIQDFNGEPLKTAKLLLDDFIVDDFYQTDLPKVLRDHKSTGIEKDAELKIRASFDALLDFFIKLSYYRQNELITRDELIYFRYYIRKIAITDWDKKNEDPKAEGIRIFITTYYEKDPFEFLFKEVR
ncbi:MAG: hypothetical protein ACK5DD_04900 [Cyclobacteriaceae bacterium]|jgi:hypothetical protein